MASRCCWPGERFGDIDIQDGNAGVQVGSYGTGALPVVNSVGIGSTRPQTANFATDITVMDLAVAKDVTQSLGKQVLLYRLDLTSASDNHGIYTGGMSYWAQSDPYRVVPTSAFYYAQQIFVVENTVTGSFNDGGYNLYGDGSQYAMLGNVMGVSKYHTARFTKLRKAIVAHNELKGINPAGIYHSLKLHSGGLTAYTDQYVDDAWYSDQVVVSHNRFGNAADTNQWTVAISPENDSSAEGVQNVLVESNTFVRNANTVLDLVLGGRSLTYRNNTASGAPSWKTRATPRPCRRPGWARITATEPRRAWLTSASRPGPSSPASPPRCPRPAQARGANTMMVEPCWNQPRSWPLLTCALQGSSSGPR
jgi:hypothetical protein